MLSYIWINTVNILVKVTVYYSSWN